MTNYTLTILDTSGIQPYIFGTNSLKQNVGASYLVDCATRKWVMEVLRDLGLPHNVRDLDDLHQPFTGQEIEGGGIQAEPIYTGGGNTAILFANRGLAVDFARRLTRRVLLEARDLQISLAHADFDWQSEALGGQEGVVKRAMRELAVQKARQKRIAGLLGLGVTAACVYTGLPAVSQDPDEKRLISAQVRHKLLAFAEANTQLRAVVPLPDGYEYAEDFNDFSLRAGEFSYLAVIHTDGNGMGNRVQHIQDKYATSAKNRDYVTKMRDFSLSIRRASIEALRDTVDKYIATVEYESSAEGRAPDRKLRFRPIVFGGDDVTFVCDGMHGLSVSAHYLQQLSAAMLADDQPAHCRAGVAVVKTHFPFAQAYALAEELCRSAKRYIRYRQQQHGEDGLTALDWHFAVSGLVQDLRVVRDREYTVQAGKLLMRPVRISDPDNDWHSWEAFKKVVNEFQSGEGWANRRNKVMALRHILREGRDATRNFREINELPRLPAIDDEHRLDMAEQGWHGDECGYFDAIEAMNFYAPLAGGQP